MIKLDVNTFDKRPELGFYEIGGKIFWDKASALIEGSKLGFKYSDLKWKFNEEAFLKFDWAVEPSGSLQDFYKIRAKQIREKYDYIILNLSGGSDSTTILYSFIQAGLFVDEVVVRHSSSAQKFGYNDQIFHAANEFSEFEYAAKPLLKWLEKVSPKTKITIHDFARDVIAGEELWDENFIHWTGDFVTPGCIVRYNHATNIDDLRNFDKGKKVGIIFGIDKPRIILKNNKVYAVFVDRPVHVATPIQVNNGFSNTTVELFFWSPELPQLIIKQAHEIKRWFENPINRNLTHMLDLMWQSNPSNRTVYEALIKGIIYPDYDLSTFQVNKPAMAAFQEWDFWMENFKDSNGYKTFMRGFDYLYKNIDKDFLVIKAPFRLPGAVMNETNWEYKVCFSKAYLIGDFNSNYSKSAMSDL
jgi:hypothetical protein